MLELTGFLGLTRISFFLLTQIPQIPLYCFVGGKSHRCFCVWVARADSTWFLGSHRSHRFHSIALWVGNLTDASVCGLARADSTLLLGSHGSHFLGSHGSHRSHSIALWVGNLTDDSACVDLCGLRWGHIALALTDLSFGPFGQIRPIGQIGRIGHF